MPSKPKIYESPDGGKTVREREFGSHLKWAIDKEMSKNPLHPQHLLTKGILPPDIFYKLFGKKHES